MLYFYLLCLWFCGVVGILVGVWLNYYVLLIILCGDIFFYMLYSIKFAVGKLDNIILYVMIC